MPLTLIIAGGCIAVLCLLGSVAAIRRRGLSPYALLAGLALALSLQVLDFGAFGLLRFIGGGMAGFVLLAPFCIAGVLSWDDVRLMGVTGSILGPTAAFFGSLVALLIGAILILGLFMARRALAAAGAAPDPGATLVLEEHHVMPALTGFPFAIAIASGAAVALAVTPLVSGIAA
jgi:Flp pilus assembly protein protease CpaA